MTLDHVAKVGGLIFPVKHNILLSTLHFVVDIMFGLGYCIDSQGVVDSNY